MIGYLKICPLNLKISSLEAEKSVLEAKISQLENENQTFVKKLENQTFQLQDKSSKTTLKRLKLFVLDIKLTYIP